MQHVTNDVTLNVDPVFVLETKLALFSLYQCILDIASLISLCSSWYSGHSFDFCSSPNNSQCNCVVCFFFFFQFKVRLLVLLIFHLLLCVLIKGSLLSALITLLVLTLFKRKHFKRVLIREIICFKII